MAIEITKGNLLVVEGRDEELFFGALLKHMQLQNIQVIPIGGKTNLRPNLKALTLSPQFSEVSSLGVLRDANDDPSSAFGSVRDALIAVGLAAPQKPLVTAGDSPRVTVMILPEENSPGMLEGICLRAVENDRATSCVGQYFQCLREQNLSLPRNISKAKIQVFLASRSEAGKRLGEAAQAGYWPWDHAAFEELKHFLSKLAR
jgi:hypothetical protein